MSRSAAGHRLGDRRRVLAGRRRVPLRRLRAAGEQADERSLSPVGIAPVAAASSQLAREIAAAAQKSAARRAANRLSRTERRCPGSTRPPSALLPVRAANCHLRPQIHPNHRAPRRGGYSFVYTGVDPAGGRKYALKKVLAQDAETAAIAEIEIEARAAARSRASSSASARSEARVDHTRYWMLELCEGSLVDAYSNAATSTKTACARRGARPRDLRGRRRAVALHAAAAGDAPRPQAQTLLAPSGEYVLCDFGHDARRAAGASRKQALEEEEFAKYSTAMYRAPEMVDLYRKHEVGPRLIVGRWAASCTLCFRAHPFAADSPLQILNGAYTIPPDRRTAKASTRSCGACSRPIRRSGPPPRGRRRGRAGGRDPPPPKPPAAPAPPLALPPLDAGFDAAKWSVPPPRSRPRRRACAAASGCSRGYVRNSYGLVTRSLLRVVCLDRARAARRRRARRARPPRCVL